MFFNLAKCSESQSGQLRRPKFIPYQYLIGITHDLQENLDQPSFSGALIRWLVLSRLMTELIVEMGRTRSSRSNLLLTTWGAPHSNIVMGRRPR